jgi:hypothetical protein
VKKVISFSLWGSDEKYCVGAIKNADLALEHYPGWVCRYHIGASTPHPYIDRLQKKDNTEVILRREPGDWTGMFWRFEDASDLSVEVMISRDTDSRLSARESAAVSEWLASDKKFHIMRDHPYHATEILGGMWGVKNPYLGDMKHLISKYTKGDFWQVDQNFLRTVIYPIINSRSFVHDEYFEKKPFPINRRSKFFVGQAFNADDTPFEPKHTDLIA